MLQTSTLNFLRQLRDNNNKSWFDEHRDNYQAARLDFEQFCDKIRLSIADWTPELFDQETRHCIFRIYKDVRFSKDKMPYKSHLSAYFSKGGRKYEGAGYYLHIEPDKSFVAGGIWMPSSAVLKLLRQEIDYNLEEFQRIVESKPFLKLFGTITGEQVKTVPKGYEKNNPAINYLKFKSIIAEQSFTDNEVLQKNFLKSCQLSFRTMQPLVEFINRSLD